LSEKVEGEVFGGSMVKHFARSVGVNQINSEKEHSTSMFYIGSLVGDF
jgi:hypothetical protein